MPSPADALSTVRRMAYGMPEGFVMKPLMGLVFLLALATSCSSAGGVPAVAAEPQADFLPLTAPDLRPGLAVIYFDRQFVRHIDQLPQGENAANVGRPGAPVAQLNHQFGQAEVFQSGSNRGVGVEFTGYLKLDQPGRYRFQANSNDGFRMEIGGQRVVDDPAWHSDRLSAPGEYEVPNPGWYPVRMRYFQRKGTATLQLYWQTPRDPSFRIVPAEALAHSVRQAPQSSQN
jgi:hypothetical protein